jgi:putative lipase involved disintegration of autophagic bodies
MVLPRWNMLATLVSLIPSLSTSSSANSFPLQQPLSELNITPTMSSELANVHQFVSRFVASLSPTKLTGHQTLRHILIPGRETHKRFDIPRLLHNRHEVPVFIARSQSTRIQRLVDRQPSSVKSLSTSTQMQGHLPVLDEDAWILEHVAGPNVSDRKTVINLATMASDAYLPDTADPTWFNLTDGYNRSQSFGWQASGIRGHVFADQDNSTIVIAIKGTEQGQLLPTS